MIEGRRCYVEALSVRSWGGNNMRKIILAGLAALLATTAAAQDVAVLIGNRDHDRAGTVRGADAVFDLQFPLREAGFQVISGRDLNGDEFEDVLDALLDRLDDADRLVFVLAGHVVNSDTGSLFLPADANPGSGRRLSRNALTITELMQIAATRPGGAVIAIGTERGAVRGLDRRWREGLGGVDVPQGVTLVTGSPEAVTDFVEEVMLSDSRSVLDGVRAFEGAVAVEGFIGRLHPFLGGGSDGSGGDTESAREEGFWAATQVLGNTDAVEAYLDRYPNGAFAAEASALLGDIRERPQREAEAAEAALGLDRNERRAIQRALVLLGYNTRGVDGIFGRGTRAGIREWQGDAGRFKSGYFDAPQLDALNAQARVRQDELEAEAAERARQEASREDGVWRRTERTDTAEAYRAYMERYPDGTYEADAVQRLRQFERQARREARAEERLFWDEVRQDGSIEAYELYLQRYPSGAFAGDAQASLAELQSQTNTSQLAATENQVLGNPVLRLLAERRWADLGLEPGRVDGQFDDATRRAIRRFQRARDIEATGFVDQTTAARMLAEAVGGN
jgi:peptidoglycan hydrolase-like protein with peptidoglycan-binding domain